MQGLARSKETHNKAIVGLADSIHSMMKEGSAKHKKDKKEEESEDESRKEIKQMLQNLPDIYKFSTVNKKVEQRLTTKPLSIPGCGLPPAFK